MEPAPKRQPGPLVPWHVGLGLLLFVAILAALSATGLDPYKNMPEPLAPASVADPYFLWFFEYVVPVGGAAAFVAFSWQSYRRRTLTWWWLFFVAGAACFWCESVGDWGFYLTYSPRFSYYELPFSFPWHVAHNPWFMPWAYGLYWGAHAWGVIKVAQWWSRRKEWSEDRSLLLFAIPVGYAWDFLVEGTATYLGWWQYDPPLGPYISWEFLGGQGNMPLTFPILIMMGWPNLIAWFAGDPATRGPGRIERLFGLQALLSQEPASLQEWQWRYEFARTGAWVLFFWVSFTLLQLLPIIVIRYLFGGDSVYAPWPS